MQSRFVVRRRTPHPDVHVAGTRPMLPDSDKPRRDQRVLRRDKPNRETLK